MIASTTAERVPAVIAAHGAAGEWLTTRRFALALAVILLAVFAPVLIGGQTFVFRDFSIFGYPVAFYHRECFWRGEIPLWNPLNGCGIPFLAQWNTMVLYPPSLIYLLLPLPWSLNLFCVLHLFLGGLGMFCLAVRWTGCRLGAATAGVVFCFSGILTVSLIWPNIVAVLGWMPWVLLAVEKAWKEGGAKVWLAAIVGALQMLAGMPEYILITWLLLVGLWLIEGPTWKTFGRFATVVLLVSGLAAAQLLPFWQLLNESKRDVLFRGESWALPLWGWANFFVPLFHAKAVSQGVYFPAQQPLFTSYYLSLPALVMAVWALLKVRQRRVWFLLSIALLGIWLAMGVKGYLYGGLLELCPSLAFMRYPVKFLALTLIAVPLLAAFGVAHWRAGTDGARDSRMLMALGGLFAGVVVGILIWAHTSPLPAYDGPAVWWNGLGRAVWLAGGIAALAAIKRFANSHARQLGWSITLLAVILADSLTQVPKHYPTAPANVYTSGVLATRVEKPPPPERGRAVMGTDKFLFFNMLPDPFNDLMGRRASLLCNLNLLDHVASLDGFYAMYLPAQREAWTRIYTAKPNEFPEGLADFMALSHITSPTNVMAWIVRTNAMTLISAGQKPQFVKTTSTLPLLLERSFNPRTTVYLPEEARGYITATNPTDARIVAERVESHHLEADIETATPSLVVISQSDYRPWRAFVDGTPVRIWRANCAFQAVELPAGRHRVRLVYKDLLFERGCAISLLSLGGCLFGLLRARKSMGTRALVQGIR